MRRVGGALMLALVLGGCSVGKDVPLADGAVGQFHQLLNAGRFAQIYAAASPEMKSATSEADLTRLLAAIHRKLGDPFRDPDGLERSI
jgi:hypothetical protein